MSDYVTEATTRKIVDQAVNKAVDDISGIIADFAEQVDIKFKTLEEKFDTRFDKVISVLDTLIGRIDRYETEQFIRERQFQALVTWAHKVGMKTNIPPENL